MVCLWAYAQILNVGSLMTLPSKILPTKSEIHDLLAEFSSGDLLTTAKGFKINCPWHDDLNPSCIVFFKNANFYCFVCHGDRPKGERGASAYTGFTALGMSKERARAIFLSGQRAKPQLRIDSNSRLPSLDSITLPEEYKPITQHYEQVVSREPWPTWDFRGIPYEVLAEKWFQDRFSPSLVMLKKERHPRIALAIGGSEEFKNTREDGYQRDEVYLRLASVVKAKAINKFGLNLDPEVKYPKHATLFGLVNNTLCEGCKGVILVEGPFDAMNLLKHIHAIGGGYEVIALLGTPQWSNCVKQIKMFLIEQMEKKAIPIILAFDNDTAGVKLTKTAITELRLGYISSLKILGYPQLYKDPGDLPLDELIECLRRIENGK